MTVEEQLEKLLYSIERFKESYKSNKREAVGDMDFVRDRANSIIYLTLAEIEMEESENNEM